MAGAERTRHLLSFALLAAGAALSLGSQPPPRCWSRLPAGTSSVELTLVSVELPRPICDVRTFAPSAPPVPAAGLGCIVGQLRADLRCSERPEVVVRSDLDQQPVTVEATHAGEFHSCEMKPGGARVTMCSSHGEVSCAIGFAEGQVTYIRLGEDETNVAILHAHVDRTVSGPAVPPMIAVELGIGDQRTGYPTLTAGDRISVSVVALPSGRFELVCSPFLLAKPPQPAQGCARCGIGDGASGGDALVLVVIVFAVVRRRGT